MTKQRTSKCSLSREEENQLIGLVRAGDSDALSELYEVNREFGLRIVMGRCRYRFDESEREQLVWISVWQAAMRFDTTVGTRFTTYLKFCFVNNANRTLEAEGRTIRIPNVAKSNSRENVREKRRMANGVHNWESIEAEDKRQVPVWEEVHLKFERESRLEFVRSNLDGKNLRIFDGLMDGRLMRDVGKSEGVTYQRVQQVKMAAVAKLQKAYRVLKNARRAM